MYLTNHLVLPLGGTLNSGPTSDARKRQPYNNTAPSLPHPLWDVSHRIRTHAIISPHTRGDANGASGAPSLHGIGPSITHDDNDGSGKKDGVHALSDVSILYGVCRACTPHTEG